LASEQQNELMSTKTAFARDKQDTEIREIRRDGQNSYLIGKSILLSTAAHGKIIRV